jgi:hypothetical protein
MRACLLSLLPLVGAGCDAFAIRCANDGDCPQDLPYCVERICVDEDEAERRGRRIDDNGACTADADCPGGLCYDVVDDSGFSGTCLPPAEQEDCAGASEVRAPARDPAGPVLFAAEATHIGDGCYNVNFRIFDRENDADGGFAELFVNGAALTQSMSVAGGTAGGTVCGAQFGQRAGLLVRDEAGNNSNTLCLPAPE